MRVCVCACACACLSVPAHQRMCADLFFVFLSACTYGFTILRTYVCTDVWVCWHTPTCPHAHMHELERRSSTCRWSFYLREVKSIFRMQALACSVDKKSVLSCLWRRWWKSWLTEAIFAHLKALWRESGSYTSESTTFAVNTHCKSRSTVQARTPHTTSR